MSTTTATPDKVEQTITESLAEFGPEPDDIKRDATFEQLDVDSLDLVELGQVIEDRFGVKLEGDDVKDLKTVGDAIDLVVKRAA
jgi:acyl carrier protein